MQLRAAALEGAAAGVACGSATPSRGYWEKLEPQTVCWVQALAPGADTELDAAALEAVAAGAPAAELPRSAVVGAPLADVLAAVGLQPSKAAARRLIKACNPRHMNL